MRLGFFFALRSDPIHFLHASSLVAEVRRRMPGVEIVQFTDDRTPRVSGVSSVHVQPAGQNQSLLDLRLSLYAACGPGDWLHVDTDVSVRANVVGVFDDQSFDVALCDRDWPHLPQGDQIMHTMPFNTGVVFVRNPQFWVDVLAVWRGFPDDVRSNWMSEQAAAYQVVRSGAYHVKILPGMAYNYPPPESGGSVPLIAALVHYKGPRKVQLTHHAHQVLSDPTMVIPFEASTNSDSVIQKAPVIQLRVNRR